MTAVMFLLVLPGPSGALAQSDDELAVQGTLRNAEDENAPVPGVSISVTTADGEEVGSAETGEDGAWSVTLPAAGAYSVQLIEDTLPEDVALRDPDRNPLEVDVREGRPRTVLFALGEGSGGRAGMLSRVLNLSVDGVKFGLVIAMTAIGLSLIFGTTGLVNFAHGELVAFGAIIAWYGNTAWFGGGTRLILATVLAVAAGALLGGGLERGLWRPLRNRGTGLIAMLVVSIGLSLFIRHILLFFFGGRSLPYSDYTVQSAMRLGPISITPKDLWIIILSAVVLGVVGLVLQRTKIGKAMRAVADNRDLAESSGIDVQKVILVVWMFGGGLAALGGVFQGMSEAVNWNMGFLLLLLMFAGVILGGLGTAYGALAGSLVVGLVTQLSTLVFPAELKNVFALAVLAIVLMFRPQGILGRAERIG